MKAIILAAGRGTRLEPLTNTIPKPLICIVGKSILEYNLETVYKYVDEIIIVVKYKAEMIESEIGDTFKGTKVSYSHQADDIGTGGALKGMNYKTDVIVMCGDEIKTKEDIKTLIDLDGYGALVTRVENPEKYGIYKVDSENTILEVIEKPTEDIGNLANISTYKFSSKIFELNEQTVLSPRGEYEITDAVNGFLKISPFKAIEITGVYLDVTYCWDILKANSYFLSKLTDSHIKGTIEDGVTIKGNIILEEGAILKSGTYIEGNCYIGKNTSIGPHTYLRGETVIGQGCKIGNAVEVKNSCFGNNTNAAHLSYIGDSIIGNNVNLGGGFTTANVRHDNKSIKVMVKNQLIDSGKRKLGVIIGDNVKTGVNTTTMPGRIIENDTITLPGAIVK